MTHGNLLIGMPPLLYKQLGVLVTEGNLIRRAATKINGSFVQSGSGLLLRTEFQGRSTMTRKTLFAGAALVALTIGSGAQAADTIKIGVMATLEGTYTVLGEDGVRGLKVALNKFDNKIGDKEIELVIGATDASPDSAVRAARKLVEQDQVDVVIGPLSGSEGIAIRDYAKTQPDMTFINGNHLRQSIGKLLPVQHGWRPVAGRSRRIYLQREGLPHDRDHR